MMRQPVYINRRASVHADTASEGSAYLCAGEPDYKSILTNAALRRRMSRIIKMGVACGLECIASLPSEEVGAIITATGLGCLADTEKFLNAVIENKEQSLSPVPFIQSTFNTIGAQIALIRRIQACNMTYVHRGLSFETALIDGMMRIWEGNRHVLVGAMDEITPASYLIQQRLGLLKNIKAGEGAQFFLLGREQTEYTLAELAGVSTFTRTESVEEVAKRIHSFLQQHQLTAGEIDWLVTGKNGHPKEDALYTEIENKLFPSAKKSTFKPECGEYPTASSFAVWKVAGTFGKTSRSGQAALLYNHYHSIDHSLILIRTRQ